MESLDRGSSLWEDLDYTNILIVKGSEMRERLYYGRILTVETSLDLGRSLGSGNSLVSSCRMRAENPSSGRVQGRSDLLSAAPVRGALGIGLQSHLGEVVFESNVAEIF